MRGFPHLVGKIDQQNRRYLLQLQELQCYYPGETSCPGGRSRRDALRKITRLAQVVIVGGAMLCSLGIPAGAAAQSGTTRKPAPRNGTTHHKSTKATASKP